VTAVAQGRAERVRELFPLVAEIADADLQQAVVEIWVEAWDESEWPDVADAPKGVYGGGPVRSLVEHVTGVAAGALAYARCMEEVHGWSYDRDLLLAAALLHDTSKVVETAPGPDGTPVVSEFGRLVQHGVWTAQRILNRGLGLDLAHMVVSHTPMSRTRPLNPEGIILYYVDMLDSDILSTHAHLPLQLSK
jgi:hypothetical protein